MRRSGLAVIVCVSLLAVAEQAHACTGEQPTFDEAIAGAGAIARVVVEDVSEIGEPPAGETFRVVRVLKGELLDKVQLDDPRTGLCGDTIGYYAPVGTEAIVAFGVPFYGTLINPVWIETDHPIEPVTGLGVPSPEDVASLDELERLIFAAFPDTAMPVAAGGGEAAVIGGVLLLLASAALLPRRRRATGCGGESGSSGSSAPWWRSG